jgi:phage portal protein BeeE
MGVLEAMGLRGRGDDVVVSPGRRLAPRVPVVRSGTPLEVAELAWVAEGVTRELALSIPTVQACRDVVVGTVVQLGLLRYRGAERLDQGWLLSQPDPSTAMPATMGGTVDDLLFHGRAYWRVLERDAEGFPTRARWTPVADVTPQTRSLGGAYSVLTGYAIAGVGEVAVEDVLRFDSSLPGVLDFGGRTLAAAVELEQAARRLAGVELPAGVLHNEGAELSPEEAATILQTFTAARRESGVAFVQGVKYTRENLSPADLQLIEARANAATDCARLFNMPVGVVSASPTGGATALLYANLTQQLTFMVALAVTPHLRTIEATLTTAIPRGQSCAFDVQTYLRSDPQAAAQYAIDLYAAGIVTLDEARGILGIPASSTTPDLTPGRV